MLYEGDYLEHYGIKGQKWGIRRFENEDGTLTAEGKERYANDRTGRFDGIKKALKTGGITIGKIVAKSAEHKNKPVNKMNDQELRERINRLQMEKQYKQLVDAEEHPPKQSFEQKHPLVKKVFMDTATNTLVSVVNKQFQTKADELLTDLRAARAQEKGMLDPDKKPFMQFTGGRVSEYQATQKAKKEAEAKVQKRIENARNQERSIAMKNIKSAVEAATKQERERNEHNASNAARAARNDVNNKVQAAMQDFYNSISSSSRNARDRSARRKAYDEIMSRIGQLRFYG